MMMISSPRHHHDPRTMKALDLLKENPTLMVPQAMRRSGFSVEESQNRTKQMWVRRRMPSKKSMTAGESQRTQKSVISESNSIDVLSAAASSDSSLQDSIAPRCTNGDDVAAMDASQYDLQAWISLNRGSIEGKDSLPPRNTSFMKRQYLMKSVQILHSLAGQIGSTFSGRGSIMGSEGGHNKELVHLDFIAVDNVYVYDPNPMSCLDDCRQMSAHFIRGLSDSPFLHAHDNQDQTQNKYAAMHAFARIAYSMCMMGMGPSFSDVTTRKLTTSEMNISIALSLHDDRGAEHIDDEEDEILDMMRKSYRMTKFEDIDHSKYMSAMIDAGVPLPMRRFISDLIDDEQGGIFRSEHSFTSFEDVLLDLKQMMDNPNVFLHESIPDRWKLDFGEKLYGRDAELQCLMDAATRVMTNYGDDPSKLNLIKTEVVMVSGEPGAGKSRLVRFGGTQLEKRGWCFLHCKFDRVIKAEPLSVLAHSFDEYFEMYTTCSKQHDLQRTSDGSIPAAGSKCLHPDRAQQLHDRLTNMISPEGLNTLAMYIPSLRSLLDLNLPTVIPDVNEVLIAALFCALLHAISSKDTPIIFFLDDLQWADPLSLSLLMLIIKGTQRGSLHLTSSSTNSQIKSGITDSDNRIFIMYAGSYREHGIDNNQPLTKTLMKLQNDDTINTTTIALPGMTKETLSELLSDTLGMPKRRVRPFSELVMQKTGGLPLFVVEFIRALAMETLLSHSFSRGWEWDAESIEIFPITESAAEVFAFKLRRLSKDVLLGLQIVSCFGSVVDQHLLNLVERYDGENSVDIPAALNVALDEGLVERAANLFCFSHDLIQKAVTDSIHDVDRVPLLRKLISALISGTTATDSLDSVLFLVVDLINRIGSNAIDNQRESALFAKMNLRAATKAVAVPDFAGAAMYADNGIALLSAACWETQYALCLQLHELAILSHFSTRSDDRVQLMNYIDAVFEHARNFSDTFNTHRIWIRFLSLANFPRAIQESLRALEQLGEPIVLTGIDNTKVRMKLEYLKDRFSGESETLLARSLEDQNKMKAMTVMSSLILYYALSKSYLGAFISCQMIEITMQDGYCEDSIIGAVAFAASLVSNLGDIDGGSTWGRKAMALMNKCGKESLIPAISFALYGTVFVWKEPVQSTLDFLAQGIRSSFVYGNIEFAIANTYVYIARSYNCGKHIRVLTEEVEALARQHGICFDIENGNDVSMDAPEILQLYMLPIYNILRNLQSPPSFQWRLEKNYDVLNVAIEKGQFACFHAILTNQTATEFMLRNMDNALKCSDVYYKYFEAKKPQMMFTCINNVFYDGLVNFYFMAQTGNPRHLERCENAISKMREWVRHSDWNFQNKLLLMEAEFCRITNDVNKAAVCYDASVAAARDHKFIHEEAMANELAGIFHLELGSRQRSHSYFKQSILCYQKWGAPIIARRIEAMIEKEFSTAIIQGVLNVASMALGVS